MTEDEAYKVHIQYTFNAFCKVVIRHGSILKSPPKASKINGFTKQKGAYYTIFERTLM